MRSFVAGGNVRDIADSALHRVARGLIQKERTVSRSTAWYAWHLLCVGRRCNDQLTEMYYEYVDATHELKPFSS